MEEEAEVCFDLLEGLDEVEAKLMTSGIFRRREWDLRPTESLLDADAECGARGSFPS